MSSSIYKKKQSDEHRRNVIKRFHITYITEKQTKMHKTNIKQSAYTKPCGTESIAGVVRRMSTPNMSRQNMCCVGILCKYRGLDCKRSEDMIQMRNDYGYSSVK